MIFVIMGMDSQPFDRLAQAVDELSASKAIDDDFFMQLGACNYQPKHTRFEPYLSFGDVCEKIRESNVVLTHAGAGSTLVCIQQGKHPVMVPRRAEFAEAVDDHQLPFTQKLAEGGLATAVYEMSELPSAIAAARGKGASSHVMGSASELTRWLEDFWRGLEARPSS